MFYFVASADVTAYSILKKKFLQAKLYLQTKLYLKGERGQEMEIISVVFRDFGKYMVGKRYS